MSLPGTKEHVPRPREAPLLPSALRSLARRRTPWARAGLRSALPLRSAPAAGPAERRRSAPGTAGAGDARAAEPRGVSALPARTGPGPEPELGWDAEPSRVTSPSPASLPCKPAAREALLWEGFCCYLVSGNCVI